MCEKDDNGRILAVQMKLHKLQEAQQNEPRLKSIAYAPTLAEIEKLKSRWLVTRSDEHGDAVIEAVDEILKGF